MRNFSAISAFSVVIFTLGTKPGGVNELKGISQFVEALANRLSPALAGAGLIRHFFQKFLGVRQRLVPFQLALNVLQHLQGQLFLRGSGQVRSFHKSLFQ